ncbi:alpha/beta fold hydrolase [Arhodomonas sp. SL1]|uniref:alpha/beta fold hydrolase n=1 Tax=Arhodomonas sp. SL1 TaxID=3425691 RepID=UPI003F8816A7
MTPPAYYHLGDGPQPVIVLHGWLSDHSVFAPMFPWLDTTRFRFAFMDAPGYGGSRDSELPHSMDGMGRGALALADTLGWRRFDVVGHSMGGKAAQWLCTYAEDRVRRAVGINPVPAAPTPFDDDGRALFESAAGDADARSAILDLTTGHRLGGTWLAAMTRASLTACDEDTFADYFRDWADGDFSRALAGCETPFLALAGEHDPAITAESLEATLGEWLEAVTVETLGGGRTLSDGGDATGTGGTTARVPGVNATAQAL